MKPLPKIWPRLAITASLVLSTSVQAQETNDVEILRTQLRALQENFERAQREHREQLEKLNQRIDSLLKQQATDAEAKKLEAELSRELGTPPPSTNTVSTASSDTRRAWSPADPIRIQSGGSYLDLGLVSTFAVGSSTADDIQGGTQLGGHDPNQRGFTMQGLELSLSGAVDPYFRGNANILFQVDADGESNVEVEEAWLETMSLPASLQLRAGQMLTDFGRQNPTHPHSWAFVDTPLVLGRFFGADGLRNPGARLSWLAPTPFYSELSFMVQNSHGETASSFRSGGDSHGGDEGLPLAYRHPENDRGVSNIDDLLFTPRYAASFDITDTQVLLLGASAAFGPNASGGEDAGNTRTEIYGVDLTWKWRPTTQSGGFPFVSVQTEGLLRRYDAGAFDWNAATEEGDVVEDASGQPAVLSGETLLDYGFYTQVLYGFRKGWVAGLRFDYVDSNTADYEKAGYTYDGETLGRDPQRAERWRLSPNLTWYPTEYSKIRLQYNYDDRQQEGVDHSVWLQFEFLLGAHAAHKF